MQIICRIKYFTWYIPWVGVGFVFLHLPFNLFNFQLGQMLATILVLYSGKMLGKVSFPSLSSETFPKVWPLPLFYLGNLVFGLGSTQVLSLPMMTVLRRFSILMTLIGSSISFLLKTNVNVKVNITFSSPELLYQSVPLYS